MLRSFDGGEGRGLGEHVVEGRPVHELHGDVRQLTLLLDVVDGDDAGVREDARRARLAEEPLPQLLLLLGLARAEVDRLDGDRPADIRIDGVVNDAHGAAAELPDDLVPADALHSV